MSLLERLRSGVGWLVTLAVLVLVFGRAFLFSCNRYECNATALGSWLYARGGLGELVVVGVNWSTTALVVVLVVGVGVAGLRGRLA